MGYLSNRMLRRLRPFWQNTDFRFYLTLAFLVWSLLPHYRLWVHAHADSENHHSHATLSAEGIEFADQALQALPLADPEEFGGQMSSAAIALKAGAAGTLWTSGRGLSAHAHFEQDLNSVEILDRPPASTEPPPVDSAGDLLYRAPVPAVPADRPARGPPASFLA